MTTAPEITEASLQADLTGRCRRCNRPLRSASAVASGIGRTCAIRQRAEDRMKAVRESVAAFSQVQRDKAEALVLAGKFEPLDRDGLYKVKGSDGVTVYRCSALGCPCQSRGPCYHMAVAAMADAYRKAA